MRLIANGKDISQFYTKCTWSGSKGEASRKLDFSVIVSGTDKSLPTPYIAPESEVLLITDDGQTLFSGFVVTRDKSIGSNTMDITCMDKLFYFNQSKGTFNFEEKAPQDIASEVFSKFGLATGELAEGSPITRSFDVESLYNIVFIAYKLENEKTGKPYMIRMNDGKAEVVEQGKTVAKYELDAESTLVDAKYSDSAEGMVTHVKMFDTDGKEIGEVEKIVEMMTGGGGESKENQTDLSLEGNNNKEKAWTFFKNNGFSDAATAGILGNLMQESSTNIDPSLKQKGGPGFGIAQWTTGSDRYNNLKSYASSISKPIDSLDAQLGFMLKEMDSNSSYWKNTKAGSFENFKQMSNVEDSVVAFERAYERAGKPNYSNRKKYANQCYSSYGGRLGAKDLYRQEKDEDPSTRAEAKLRELEKSASVRVFGNTDLITGNGVIVKEPFTALNGKFYIDSDTHTWENNTYIVELELNFKNIMADISTDEGSSDSQSLDSSTGGGSIGEKAIKAGESIKGTHYKWGGNDPSSGVDCSGFVQWTYNQSGANIPGRLTSSGLRSDPKAYGFEEIPFNERKPGDVLWQQGHVALVYPGDKILESGGTTKRTLGYSGVGISEAKGRTFSKAYRYVGG